MAISGREEIIEKLKTVKDPEVGLDVWTLGLVYDIKADEGTIDVTMTLTSPFCPFADEIIANTEKALAPLSPDVQVRITFEPPWQPPEALKAMLGL